MNNNNIWHIYEKKKKKHVIARIKVQAQLQEHFLWVLQWIMVG